MLLTILIFSVLILSLILFSMWRQKRMIILQLKAQEEMSRQVAEVFKNELDAILINLKNELKIVHSSQNNITLRLKNLSEQLVELTSENSKNGRIVLEKLEGLSNNIKTLEDKINE